MRSIMKKHGYLELESSPGVFYHPGHDVEINVYVDDFVMFAPKSLKERLWRELDDDVKFKDPAISLERYLGVYFAFFKDDGTAVLKTQMTNYLRDAVKAYMKELGVIILPFVPTPFLDEKFEDDPNKVVPGKFAKTCASHLMKLLYAARLARADFLVANTMLARRVSKCFSDEDRRAQVNVLCISPC
jgi:hypothetical protein